DMSTNQENTTIEERRNAHHRKLTSAGAHVRRSEASMILSRLCTHACNRRPDHTAHMNVSSQIDTKCNAHRRKLKSVDVRVVRALDVCAYENLTLPLRDGLADHRPAHRPHIDMSTNQANTTIEERRNARTLTRVG